jgi:hypothetical protein
MTRGSSDTIMSRMGFFDDLPPPTPPVVGPQPEPPPWMGPPPGWVGGRVPWHVVVLRSPDVYVVVTHFQSFPHGALLTLDTRVRPGALGRGTGVPDPSPPMVSLRSGDGLLFGVSFADGRKTAIHAPLPAPGEDPPGPVLSFVGGTGGDPPR